MSVSEITIRVFNHQPFPVLVEGVDGKIKLANTAFCSLFTNHFNCESIINKDKNIFTRLVRRYFLDPEGSIIAIQKLRLDLIEHARVELELVNGQFIEVIYAPCFSDDLLKGHIWFINNISTFKHKEKELAMSEYKHRKMVHQLNEVVFYLTYDNTIDFLNPAWKNILEYETEESVNNTIESYMFDEDKVVFKKMIFEIESGLCKEKNEVIRFVSKSGNIKWLNTYLSKTEKYIQWSVWGTLYDVTDEYLASQECIAAYEKEKELNDLKSNFINIVSHEFRTPLAGIYSSVELLELIHENSSSEMNKAAPSFDMIKSQINKMYNLINNVLLLGKIESGDNNFKPTIFLLSEIAKYIIKTYFDNLSISRKIILRIIGSEVPVFLDDTLVKHILINLLSNALKYSSTKNNPVLILNFNPNESLITVVDKGIGIPSLEINKLFNSFYRASNTGNIEGTGLGLVVVKKFVDLHQGKITVESIESKGSTFSIYLPNFKTSPGPISLA